MVCSGYWRLTEIDEIHTHPCILGSGTVHFYKFSRKSRVSELPSWAGASHGDEIAYVFGIAAALNWTQTDTLLSMSMMKHWANFAQTGSPADPDPTEDVVVKEAWVQYSKNKQYHEFSPEATELSKEGGVYPQDVAFFDTTIKYVTENIQQIPTTV